MRANRKRILAVLKYLPPILAPLSPTADPSAHRMKSSRRRPRRRSDSRRARGAERLQQFACDKLDSAVEIFDLLPAIYDSVRDTDTVQSFAIRNKSGGLLENRGGVCELRTAYWQKPRPVTHQASGAAHYEIFQAGFRADTAECFTIVGLVIAMDNNATMAAYDFEKRRLTSKSCLFSLLKVPNIDPNVRRVRPHFVHSIQHDPPNVFDILKSAARQRGRSEYKYHPLAGR
jgi:hypothetical protein